MALEVAESAVVGDDLEAVAQRLEPAPRAVAAIAPLADEIAEQRGALDDAEPRDALERLALADAGGLEEQRGQQRILVPVDVKERHRRPAVPFVAGLTIEPQPRDPRTRGLLAALQVLDPLAAAVRPVDARDEARHDRLHRAQHHPPAVARLGKRMREQVEDQLLV